MKKRKPLLALLSVATGCLVLGMTLHSQVAAESEYPPQENTRSKETKITSPCPGEFPITALVMFNPQTGPRKEDMPGIKECGFNLCMQMANAENTRKVLDYISGTGLKFIPGSLDFVMYSKPNPNWREQMQSFVDEFKDNPNLAGWILYDEPKWNQLQELKTRYDALLEMDNSHFVSINFVGQLENSHTGPCTTLPAYVDSIQKVYGSSLDVWSSDCYPFWIRNGQFKVRYKEFYEDLGAYSAKANQTGIPMWTYSQSISCKIGDHHTLPVATEPYLSFQAFSGLAYGSQGIVYWTYYMRPSNPSETYISALVDFDGNKTPAWYAAQTVNRQIRALTSVFLGAEMVECLHTGDIQMDGVRPAIENFGPIKRLTNGDKGVLASHLRNGDNHYLMIVNHDVQNRQNVRFVFSNDVSVTELKASSDGSIDRKSVGPRYNVTLAPGGYSLFEWK